jgi:transcriptional regulator with XRE-family HTH domain
MPGNLRTLRPPARTSTSCAARRLVSALHASGLSQIEAAELVGVDPRQVRRWLHGEVPMGALELLVELDAVAAAGRAA